MNLFQMLAEDFMRSYNECLNSRMIGTSLLNATSNEESNIIYLKSSKKQPNVEASWHQRVNTSLSSNDVIIKDPNKYPDEKPKKRKKKRVRYRFDRENIALYFAYEYVLFALVLDRLFFWLYFMATIISYVTTLYIFPFLMQTNNTDLLKNVP